jgi:hypothetical protein
MGQPAVSHASRVLRTLSLPLLRRGGAYETIGPVTDGNELQTRGEGIVTVKRRTQGRGMASNNTSRAAITLGHRSAALGAAVVATIALATTVNAAGAQAHQASGESSTGHASYRHGLVPMLARHGSAATIPAVSSKDLHFRGGISTVGVTIGAPKVFLVFWGSQWGTQGTNSAGNATFTGDPQGVAPDLQAFFKGLGTGSELWSGVMTQYCQGVATGTTLCGTGGQHIGYPTGGALAGIWEDKSAPAPSNSTGHQLAFEAVKASGHFGNSTSASNRSNQYFIVSPTGTDPDNYMQNGFCAWHDYTGDSTLDGGGGASGPGTPLAFANMPYVTDVGSSCGASFVNAANQLDGVTIVGGHEYAETITDQFPAGGWTANNGEENGDLCAWLSSGAGKVQNITLTTGKFAVQGTWSNLANKSKGGCAIKNAIVT